MSIARRVTRRQRRADTGSAGQARGTGLRNGRLSVEGDMLAQTEVPPSSLRLVLVIVGLGVWHLTQSLIKHRPTGTGVIGDGLHALTARAFAFFTARPVWADRLLIASSLGIDALGAFVLVESVV